MTWSSLSGRAGERGRSAAEGRTLGVTLEYTRHTLLGFEDHVFVPLGPRQAVRVGRYRGAGVLPALIGHRRYRDQDASPDSHGQDAGDIQGPYRLAAITPA